MPDTAPPPTLLMRVCSHCGAGMTVSVETASGDCAFCGHHQPFEHDVLVEPLQTHAALVDIERDGLRAFREALQRRHGTSAMIEAANILAAMCVLPPLFALTVIVQLALGWADGPTSIIGFSVGFAGMIVLMKRRVLPRYTDRLFGVAAKVDADLARWMDRVQAKATEGSCPDCAARMAVPSCTAVMRCAFCDSSLLATHGMLLHFADDLEERTRSMNAQAETASAQAATRYQRQVFGVLPVMALGFAAFVLLSAGSWMAVDWAQQWLK